MGGCKIWSVIGVQWLYAKALWGLVAILLQSSTAVNKKKLFGVSLTWWLDVAVPAAWVNYILYTSTRYFESVNNCLALFNRLKFCIFSYQPFSYFLHRETNNHDSRLWLCKHWSSHVRKLTFPPCGKLNEYSVLSVPGTTALVNVTQEAHLFLIAWDPNGAIQVMIEYDNN